MKQVSFYDDDVRFWQLWRNRSAAAEAPSAVNQHTSAFNPPAQATRGRHFLVICCENKVIFLDLVTMRGRDVPKQELDNRSLLWQVLTFVNWLSFYMITKNTAVFDLLSFFKLNSLLRFCFILLLFFSCLLYNNMTMIMRRLANLMMFLLTTA